MCKKIAFLIIFESLIIIVSKAKNCMVAVNGIKLFEALYMPNKCTPKQKQKAKLHLAN